MKNNNLTPSIYQAKYEDTFSFMNLYRTCYECCNGVMWKPSVQIFYNDIPNNAAMLNESLMNGTFKSPGFNHFKIYERGKIRDIHSVHIKERVVQKTLCNYALKPAIIPRLIHTNCASLQGKGTAFAINKLYSDLSNAYKQFGDDCYILIMDYHKYYDSIRHDILLSMVRNWIEDDKLFNLYAYFVNMFDTTNSSNVRIKDIKTINSISNYQYEQNKSGVSIENLDINAVDDNYITNIDEHIIESQETNIGLGLGSEISQLSAIAYTNSIDHMIKEKYNIKYYTKYMDDSYMIDKDKNKLLYVYKVIKEKSLKYGLLFNDKHTNLYKITDHYYFLKKQITVDKCSGSVIMQLSPKAITKHRKMMVSHKELLDQGILSMETIFNSFICWRESNKYLSSRDSLRELSRYFYSIFSNYIDIQTKKKLFTI